MRPPRATIGLRAQALIPARALLAGAALACLCACGGGGGGGAASGPPAPTQAPGFHGSVSLPDQHLGRIAEREPNPTTAQAYRLPPAFARTTLEVAGNLGATAAYYGVADAVDVLRYVVLAPSDVALRVEHRVVDPVGGGFNALTLEVRDAQGLLLDEASGASPLDVAFSALPGEPVFVSLRAVAGHTPWLATFVTSDPPPAPAPPKPTRPAGAPDAAAQAVAPAFSAWSEEHLLVRLREGVDAAAWAERHGHTLGAPTAAGTCRVLLPVAAAGASRPDARKAAKGFAGDPDVLWAEPDWRVMPLGASDDADLARQWNLNAVGAFEAWDVTRGAATMVVGVLDSGVLAHPDLAGQTVAGYDFISDVAAAGDGDGRDADPTDVGDAAASNGLSLWHGTHVASLIAGKGEDASGVSGLAPGCRVMPLRVLGRGGGLVSDVADALRFAAGLLTTVDGRRLSAPLRVVNLSLGTSAYSSELEAACASAHGEGVLIVAATGNTGGAVLYPAAFPTVLAVGAVDGMLSGTSYSCHGPQVALSAPGGFSLLDMEGDGWPDAVLGAGRDETRFPAPLGHLYQSGTSQAAPHVSAAAALLLSLDPSLQRSALRSRLESSALDLGQAGKDEFQGWGLVQAHTALRRQLEQLGTPLTTPPRLHLPVPMVRLTGLESQKDIPLVNGGGGTLTLVAAQAVTDDGGDWLGASFVFNFPGADVSAAKLQVLVDRTRIPDGAEWVSGTLRLTSATQALGLVRVIASVRVWPRAGIPMAVVPINVENGGAPALAYAHPQNDYRYVLSKLDPGTYHVRGGEDLDADGFSCEPFDLCGWFGGLTEDLATPVEYAAGDIVPGVDVRLGLSPP